MTDEPDISTIAYFAGAADAKAEITRLQAELAALKANWKLKPIESAPKKAEILVWQKRVGFWVARWRLPNMGEPAWNSHDKFEWRDSSGHWANPTHWMSLPPAPEDGA